MDIKEMNIKRIQDELLKLKKDTNQDSYYSLDFNGGLWIIVTKDEIYVKDWNPTCPSIPMLKNWDEDYAYEFDTGTYFHIEDFTDLELNDLIATMVEECKYTVRKFGEY